MLRRGGGAAIGAFLDGRVYPALQQHVNAAVLARRRLPAIAAMPQIMAGPYACPADFLARRRVVCDSIDFILSHNKCYAWPLCTSLASQSSGFGAGSRGPALARSGCGAGVPPRPRAAAGSTMESPAIAGLLATSTRAAWVARVLRIETSTWHLPMPAACVADCDQALLPVT